MGLKRILKILVVFLILSFISVTVVYASGYGDIHQFDNYTTAGTDFEIIDDTISITAGTVLDVVRIIAFCLGMLILVIIGIKYMISTPEIRAELKKDVPTYFIGVVILFAASGILKFVTYFVQDAL